MHNDWLDRPAFGQHHTAQFVDGHAFPNSLANKPKSDGDKADFPTSI